MTMTAPSSHPAGTATGGPLRWALLLAASLLLHWIALSKVSDGFNGAAPALAPPPQVVTATLRAPAEVVAAAPTTIAAPSDPTPVPPRPARRPPKPRSAVVAPVPAVAIVAADDAVAATDPAPAEAPPPAETPPAPTAAVEPKPAPAPATGQAAPASDVAATTPAPRYTVSLPPAATLEYEVRYATRGSITRGTSKIDWQPADGGYAIQGEVTKFGFALSSFRSEGTIDEAGIAPTLYAEKNARRAETNTHFQRKAAPVISFSAATDTFPLLTGAQDRASILWQLSGIARGDRKAFVPGAVLDVFVAGVRDAEHWLINIVGEEAVTLEQGETRAWHLVRTPRAGSYDKRIDIWLAPGEQWYPVKLRYTEVNGDYLDLSLAAVRPASGR
ncbi:MAG: DUF3108 domain-containing protein [Herminiimonas sp.]|nr:DUF3108 domain-containing protein [Herminiimonas sp.]